MALVGVWLSSLQSGTYFGTRFAGGSFCFERLDGIDNALAVSPRRISSRASAMHIRVNGFPAVGEEATLLDRASELAEIEAAMGGDREDPGGLAYVEGEPGIGKTRLLEAARSRAEDRGLRVSA
jgi:predicted ATP-dependent serine protease